MKTAARNRVCLLSGLGVVAVVLSNISCSFGGMTVQLTDEPSPATNGPDCMRGVLPGKTTRNELLAQLGNPLATDQEGGFEILSYAAPIYGQLNSVTLQNGVVVLVTAIQAANQPLRWSEVKAQHGEPAYAAFTNYQQGSKIYAFPTKGLAFVADGQFDAVFIRQCFLPMSLENYMLAYGNSLPTEDPFIR